MYNLNAWNGSIRTRFILKNVGVTKKIKKEYLKININDYDFMFSKTKFIKKS